MKSRVNTTPKSGNQRLDTWLWASRFYKSRKLATEAIKGGHISVNTQRAKPSKLVKIQDEVRIRRFPQTFVSLLPACLINDWAHRLPPRCIPKPIKVGKKEKPKTS